MANLDSDGRNGIQLLAALIVAVATESLASELPQENEPEPDAIDRFEKR